MDLLFSVRMLVSQACTQFWLGLSIESNVQVYYLISFFFLQANKLACSFSTDAGRRQETSESETKNFFTQHNIKSICIRMFESVPLASKFHGGDAEGPKEMSHMQWENNEHGGTH